MARSEIADDISRDVEKKTGPPVASIVRRASLPPVKSTMPVQKVPAPTPPGIRSDPSKRKVVALTRISP